jgi:hypothetical protein
MDALRDIAPYAALAGVALALILLVAVIALWISLRRLRRAQTLVLGQHEQTDVVAHVVSLDSRVSDMREAVETLSGDLREQRARLDHTITHRAIVRYDAFRDAGGEQSASLALLDDHRSGVVVSTIAARDFARVYVKYLREGVADRDLSPEEQEVIAAAVPRPLESVRQLDEPTPAERPPSPPQARDAGSSPSQRAAFERLAGGPAPRPEGPRPEDGDDRPGT